MTMFNPSAPQNLSKQHCCYLYVGGGGGIFAEGGVGVMSRLEGYGCSSEAEANLINCLGGGGRGGGGGGGSDSQAHLLLVVGQMADQEDESRTTESVNEATGSTSLKDATHHHDHDHDHDHDQEDHIDKDDKWLQLSIGGHTAAAPHKGHNIKNYIQQDNQLRADQSAVRGGMIELDLLPGSASTTSEHELRSSLALDPASSRLFQVPEFRAPPRPPTNTITSGGTSSSSNYYSNRSLFMQHPASISSFPHHHHHHHHQEIEINWGEFRPIQRNIITASTSSSRLVPPAGPYFARPFLLHAGLGLGIPRPSTDFRVIDPPRRPHSGIWFTLQAAQDQAKEPFLPQISKSFLRIKDGSMTIRIVMKYLVHKLKLENESEVEIKCRGQQVVPILTLQHVRDSMWRTTSDDVLTLLPDSSTSTTDHLMVLHYGRSP